MILSEHERRWVEVRFYYFLLDIYNVRNKTTDIIDMVEIICQIRKVDLSIVRKITNLMLNDTYYQPHRREVILLGHLFNVSNSTIGKYIGTSRQNVDKYIRTNLDNYTPIPRCDIHTDHELKDFLDTWEKVSKAGYYYDNTNKRAV